MSPCSSTSQSNPAPHRTNSLNGPWSWLRLILPTVSSTTSTCYFSTTTVLITLPKTHQISHKHKFCISDNWVQGSFTHYDAFTHPGIMEESSSARGMWQLLANDNWHNHFGQQEIWQLSLFTGQIWRRSECTSLIRLLWTSSMMIN